MSIQCRIKFSVIFFIFVISTSSGYFDIFQKYQKKTFSEDGAILTNCLKDIILAERMKNVLIVGRAEHYRQFNVRIIGNITRMKIYKRTGGWKQFGPMLQFRLLTYILLIDKYFQFEESLRQFHLYQVYNSRLPFILLPLHYPTETEIEKYGELLIATRIINHLILLRNSTNTVKLITNFPFKNRMCGNYSSQNNLLLATYHENRSFEFAPRKVDSSHFYADELNSDLFPAKIPRDLKKCEIRIVTGLWPPNVIDVDRERFPGIEIEFTRDIARHMNFVPKFLYTDSIVGERLPNRTWTGFMGHLERNEVDMAIGAVHVDAGIRVQVFDVSDWYLYNYMLWIVPLMKPLSKSAVFEHFLIESSLQAKALFISIFLSTTIAMLSAAKLIYSKDSHRYSRIGYICVTLVRMFLSQPHDRVPKTIRVRRIFASWLGFCTFIIFFFQTSITSYFMASGKAVQLDNIQQAFDLNLRITYDAYYDNHIKNAQIDLDVIQRNEKLAVIPSLILVAKGEAVTFIDRLRAIYITKQWLREDGSIPIRLLSKDPVHRYWVQVVMTKGHFLSPWVNELVGRTWSSGFWTFKQNQYIERRTIQCSVRRQIILNNDIQGLNNTNAVDRYNDGIYEAFPTGVANEQVNKIFAPTAASKEDLLGMFRVSTNTKITFTHMQTVFELYLYGMIVAIISFVCEKFELRVKDFIRTKYNKKKC